MTTGTMLDDSDNVKKPGSLGRQAVGSESVPLKGESFEDTAANVNEGTFRKLLQRLTERLSKWGVETEGVAPIPINKRTDTRIYQMFWLWFSANSNVLAFSTGSAGPAFFGLNLKYSVLILLVVNILTCAIPAYFVVLGPKLGMRGMVHARFSWGLYGAIIPSFLNVISTLGSLILNCIIGGQILAAISTKLDYNVGIVITSGTSLVVTFFGYRVMHWFESFAWVPAVITFPTLLGLANKHLNPSTMPSLPTPSASMMLSFASFVASGVVSWCTITPDYGVYHDHNGSAFKIFLYSYFGFLLPSVGHIVAWGMMGAAFAAAEPGIPSWKEGYDNGNDLGGLLGSVLSPTGVIGYWSTSFGTIVLIEHFVFRTSFQSYDIERWDKAELLPPGIAAVIAFLGSLGIIIPSMQQTWYTGPIAASGTGDIGVFTGAAVTVLLYTPLRAIERRIWPGR
uniref:Uncharacterized protein n=1 Tax=Psilocybe cubensis TaxID=181762 RepID=A0A8H8CG34_PSICU